MTMTYRDPAKPSGTRPYKAPQLIGIQELSHEALAYWAWVDLAREAALYHRSKLSLRHRLLAWWYFGSGVKDLLMPVESKGHFWEDAPRWRQRRIRDVRFMTCSRCSRTIRVCMRSKVLAEQTYDEQPPCQGPEKEKT